MDGKLQPQAVRLGLSDIRFKPLAWPRLAHDPDRVAEFASLYQEGGESALPPIETVGEGNLLSDSLHRWLAADAAGLSSLLATRVSVPEGTDEITFAFLRGIKASTGGHRELTRTERRHGIKRLVEETDLSDAQIAELFGVARQTVWRIRNPDVANATSPRPGVRPTSARSRPLRLQHDCSVVRGTEARPRRASGKLGSSPDRSRRVLDGQIPGYRKGIPALGGTPA